MAAARPSSGWIKGIVKEVPSGDTLTIASGPKLGAPEKRITLSSLIAPKLGKRDGSTQDEDFAWESREFLRKLCVGKLCTFRVDYTLENIPGREFGSVFVAPASENVALKVVAEGWAKVRESGGSQSPYIEQLLAATKAAETQKKGIFTQDKATAARSNRGQEFDPQEVLDKVGKGKPVAAVVEQVGNGSTLRVTLLEDLQFASVQICGVQCPSIGRRGGPEVEAIPAQPFALEAKHFSEMAVLNREIRVLLQGVDKHNNLIGSVIYSSSAGADAKPTDLGKELVERGLAKVAEWGLQMMITGSQSLREAERRAKQSRAGIWHDYVQPASAGVKLSDNFKGTVVEIVSGDVVCVKDAASGVERRVTLSSIRAPKLGGRDRPGEPLARESREFLRQRLIGKEVQVSMEYTRKVPLMANGIPLEGSAAGERQLDFGSVHIEEKVDKKETKLINVAAMLLQRGLAQVVKHRTDDERSAQYETLLEAEQTGIKNKKGLHRKREGDKSVDSFHVNDISQPGNSAKAKQHLAFLTRGKQNAVVEAVLSGNRLKLYIEKEGIMLAFSPSGVRAPQRPQQAGSGRPAVEGEPYWEEAVTFTRQNFLQRDVEIEVETVDRGGSFLGTVLTKGPKPLNLGLALLANGLAKLHPSFEPSRISGGKDLALAEAKARDKRLKVWEKYVPQEVRASNGHAAEAEPSTSSGETMSMTVTELVDANTFYVQKAADPRMQWISEQMQSLAVSSAPSQPPRLKQGDLCLAIFSLDNQLYRARVESADTSDPVSPSYRVFFIDFGNREKVKARDIRLIDPGLQAVPPQAHQASLAYLKVKGLDDEVGNEAARFLSEQIGGGKELSAQIVIGHLSSPQPVQLLLFDKSETDVGRSMNARLLSAGLARFQPPKLKVADSSTTEALQASEQAARKEHVGMWQYGDPGDDSDEEQERPKNAWGRR